MKESLQIRVKRDFKRNRNLYIMAIPMVLYYILFHYIPMGGAVIAFEQYSPATGILKSPWVGMRNFRDFFSSVYFLRLIRNTLMINVKWLVFGFPLPILFAILLTQIFT